MANYDQSHAYNMDRRIGNTFVRLLAKIQTKRSDSVCRMLICCGHHVRPHIQKCMTIGIADTISIYISCSVTVAMVAMRRRKDKTEGMNL